MKIRNKAKSSKFAKAVVTCITAFSLTAGFALPAYANEMPAETSNTAHSLSVGAAVRDITPTVENGLLPIDGTGKTTLVGVIDPIHVRVAAISDSENTSLVVSFESGRGPYGPQYAQALSEHTELPIEAIFYSTTHSHAVPEITEEINLDYEENDPEVTNLQRWGKLAMEQMLDAADEALAEMEPATMGIGYSESYINVNRNRTYTAEDGSSYRSQGYNPTGPSDKTVAAVRFDDMDGNPIAFIVNYAVHGTVMYANQCIDGGTGVSSDIPGYVSNCLENSYDDSVALWISGAAGDQNPIFANEYFTPAVDTNDKETTYIEDGCEDILEYLGKIHYSDVQSALASIDSTTSDASVNFAYGGTSIPASEDNESGSDEYGLQLQVLHIGDVALVGCAGELFSSTGSYLKDNSLLDNTIIANHVWTHEEQFANYLADDEGRILGGQGCKAAYEPGYINSALTILMNDLINETSAQ
ncbi:MAG: hypothetical protein Q4D16_23295 [Eubacteriales bacterium]|nr:hypothetical protein [Eubacteriales bacterium]